MADCCLNLSIKFYRLRYVLLSCLLQDSSIFLWITCERELHSGYLLYSPDYRTGQVVERAQTYFLAHSIVSLFVTF